MVPLRTAAVRQCRRALLVPAAAQAKTKTVSVGPPPAAAKKLGAGDHAPTPSSPPS